MADTYIDPAPFLSDRFDVNAYANAVLSGQAYRPDDVEEGVPGPSSTRAKARPEEKGDVGLELAKLNHGIVGRPLHGVGGTS